MSAAITQSILNAKPTKGLTFAQLAQTIRCTYFWLTLIFTETF